ncbi:MAG: hypothetical protein JF886_00445 [Candidatus Dormibacteraeota bacterium]|uniref:Uncharacterized protein n=1 Tax=Candidatus Aeolococcus gillhamiae TaxID=3127015 RepID=A0A2W5ZBP8_9BACT|nr:hypothetical protein [Candidatus Dormibacteraeota bacterium]PZR81427.1 MAG: hypothetical protein DLM65_05915 [Candidatus Dormibacter sp. RRmetagenome_bin12]
MSGTSSRARGALRAVWHAIVTMPRPARFLLVALAAAAAFVAVIVPLFSSGGAPRAEIAGQLPQTVAAGHTVQANIALDNVGDSIIYPVCVVMSGDGATLASADFQGLDHVTASGNRVCGGQLTGQETIGITIQFRLSHRGNTHVQLVPQQGNAVIGPAFAGTVGVT